MPWKETGVKSERIHFVVDALRGEETMRGLCRRYGISRKTGYKWLRRWEEVGCLGALDEQSRRPHRSPRQTPAETEDRVVSLRQQYGWGSRKLRRLLEREGIKLARATIDRILVRRGLIGASSRSRPAVRRFERSAPNELLQMDFKGPYELRHGRVCLPLSLLDDHSRYALAVAPLASTHGIRVQRVLEASFERYGVPIAMLVDHGTPWWSSTNGHGLTRVGVFLIRQGVRLVFSGIGHPQTQGKVERFHHTLGAWLQHHGTPDTRQGFQEALRSFRREYNEVRPHEALGLETPSQRYRPSTRRYQPNPPEWHYPVGAEVRRLVHNGCLFEAGRYHFVCHALAGRRVRLERFADRILISYRHMLIRELATHTGISRSILEPYGPTGHRGGGGPTVLRTSGPPPGDC
jgi:transposase InsO family protein